MRKFFFRSFPYGFQHNAYFGSMTWDAAKSKFTRFKPFDDPLYRDLMELVFTHVREYFIVIDRDFIYEIGVLYLSIAAQAMIASLKNRFQEE